ncbi:MAG: DUF11 domain-containing protein [Chitinivibrionales bacterium]|nr:DUF11 domain-containing protein [Chitinivibrionales bacterium]
MGLCYTICFQHIHKTAATLVIFFSCAVSLFSDTIVGPPADGESVLLIYTSTTQFNKSLKDAFKEALTSITPPAIITEVEIKSGDGGKPGFFDELSSQTGKKELSSWCQVYDLRFRDDRNNIGWTGQKQEDVLTYIGTDTDWKLFEDYLNLGGSLFLQGEHHDYYIRDANLLMFVNFVAQKPINQLYADIHMDQIAINGFAATPEKFSTDFNNLSSGSLMGNFAGGINLKNIGSGRPITTLDIGAMALAYLPQDLKTSLGRMIVSFESNAFTEPDLVNATSKGWIQNVYDLLSGCHRYDLTKTFTPDTITIDSNGVFTLAYKNNGGHDMFNVTISDTIPTCLKFISSTPSPSGNSGNYYWWTIDKIPPNSSAEIKVTYRCLALPTKPAIGGRP